MKHFLPIRLRVERDIVARVVRVLRGSGSINVRVGQQVAPEDLIGSGTIESGFRTINLSTLLSVPPGQVEKYLTRELKQRIYKGELLAFKQGFLFSGKKIVTSPTDGILDFINPKTGELRIAFLPKKVDLPAGVFGFVEGVDSTRGQVVIKTLVSKVYGMFGSGRVRDGILYILGKKDSLVSRGEIQQKLEGQILVGGGLFFKDAVAAAISTGVSGIITGGINAADYKGMAGGRLTFPRKLDNDIGIGIVVCEGFGSVPIGTDIYGILSEYEGKFVFMDGNKAVISLPSFSSASLTKVKNTQLPPLQSSESGESAGSQKEPQELEAGLQVRITGNSYLGEQGKILSVDSSLTLLPSGIKTYLALVETGRRKLQVPVANLEVIG